MSPERRERAGHVIARRDSRGAVGILVGRGFQLRQRGVELGFFGRERSGGAERRAGRKILLACCPGRHDPCVQRHHRLREQFRAARLRLLSIDDEPDDAERDDHHADHHTGNLSLSRFEEIARALDAVRELVLFQMVTFFALHGCLLVSRWVMASPVRLERTAFRLGGGRSIH